MSATFGTLLILVSLFLPGLLFQRFYYSGEFSKQFHTRIPLIQIGFRSFLPGLIIQIFGLSIVNSLDKGFTLQKANLVYHELLGSPTKYSIVTTFFLENQIWIFICYSISACFLGVFLGHITQWIVRRVGLDVKFKIFRFKNNWSYIFNGKYLKFDKVKEFTSKVPIETTNLLGGQDVMMTIVDVVVVEGGEKKMYSGTFIDYDIDFSDNNNLERIYLTNVYRYKFKSESEISKKPFLKRFEKKNIPGSLFILEVKNLANINLTYVPSQNKSDFYIKLINATKLFLSQITLLLNFFFIGLMFIGFDKIKFIDFIYKEFNILEKVVFGLTLLIIGSVVFYDSESKIEKSDEYNQAKKGMWFLIFITATFTLYEFWIYTFL